MKIIQKSVKSAIDYIPQKAPFVMIGELIHSDETVTRSGFTITADNVFTINGQFSEAGLMENIAQTAALRAGYIAGIENKPVELGYIGAVTNFEVFHLPVTGDQLVTEITVEESVLDVSVISGKVWCNNQLMAQCGMKVFKA